MAESEKLLRLSRLTSILLQLQTKPMVSVKELAKKFEVSTRTIYRDLQALEESGVPIVAHDNKGYSLMEGYNIPPVMFTESEAHALMVAEKFMEKTKDASLIAEFTRAIDKIKSVLRHEEKAGANILSERIIIGKNWNYSRTSSYLSEIQLAISNFRLIKIFYKKEGASTANSRSVEPFAIYHNTDENWVLIAWCRLRNDFRSFRVDRIENLTLLEEKFPPHKMTLAEYVEIQRKKHEQKRLT